MKRPPRNSREPLFSRQTVVVSIIQGVIVFGVVLGVFFYSLNRGDSVPEVRALSFTTLIISNLALILTNRSWSRTFIATLRSYNYALLPLLAGAVLLLAVVLFVPFFVTLFKFSSIHPFDLVVCFLAGLASVLWFEALKWFGFFRKNIQAG